METTGEERGDGTRVADDPEVVDMDEDGYSREIGMPMDRGTDIPLWEDWGYPTSSVRGWGA